MSSDINALVVVVGLFLLSGHCAAHAALIHRWSFSEKGATIARDSTGDAHGFVRGSGGLIANGNLRLPGGSSLSAAYLDLPNGLISGLTDVTIEGWATIEGRQSWARIFDFGSTAGGELEAPGGGGEGQDYLAMAALRGELPSQQRIEIRNRDPAFGGREPGNVSPVTHSLDTTIPTELGEEFHFAIVYDPTPGELRHYRNGMLEGTVTTSIALGHLNHVNNWVGRSNWTGDANFQGSIDEFRIYDNALTDEMIGTSFARGPDFTTSGDYNANGRVEQADLDLVLLNWGRSGTPPPSGWVNDLPTGMVDQLELDVVLLNWGNVAASPPGQPVPELPSGRLVGLIMLCGVARRCPPKPWHEFRRFS